MSQFRRQRAALQTSVTGIYKSCYVLYVQLCAPLLYTFHGICTLRRETCEEAVAKLSQDQVALACQDLLSPIVIGNPGATPDLVSKYCTDSRHCSALLVPIFDEIGRLCGGVKL